MIMIIINTGYLSYIIHEIIKFVLLAASIIFLIISKYMISIILLLLLIVIWLEEIKDTLFLDEELPNEPKEDIK